MIDNNKQFIKAFSDNVEFIIDTVFPNFMPSPEYDMKISITGPDEYKEFYVGIDDPYDESAGIVQDIVNASGIGNNAKGNIRVSLAGIDLFNFPFDEHLVDNNDEFASFMVDRYNYYVGLSIKDFIREESNSDKFAAEILNSKEVKKFIEMDDEDIVNGGVQTYKLISQIVSRFYSNDTLADDLSVHNFLENSCSVGILFDISDLDNIKMSLCVNGEIGEFLFINDLAKLSRDEFINKREFERCFTDAWNRMFPHAYSIDNNNFQISMS